MITRVLSGLKNIPDRPLRVFKTAWFAREARRTQIQDAMLCKAIRQVIFGQADNLGGGVYKKRLNNNQHRAIILASDSRCWIFVYLFAKNDRENIRSDELAAFKRLADDYAHVSVHQINQLITENELTEICNECQIR